MKKTLSSQKHWIIKSVPPMVSTINLAHNALPRTLTGHSLSLLLTLCPFLCFFFIHSAPCYPGVSREPGARARGHGQSAVLRWRHSQPTTLMAEERHGHNHKTLQTTHTSGYKQITIGNFWFFFWFLIVMLQMAQKLHLRIQAFKHVLSIGQLWMSILKNYTIFILVPFM